jgi:hypothetical protein
VAVTQLCAPEGEAGVLVLAAPIPAGQGPRETAELPPAPSCDEGEAFRCVGGNIVACAERRILARCVRGCFREGAGIDGETSLLREKAYALLCAR